MCIVNCVLECLCACVLGVNWAMCSYAFPLDNWIGDRLRDLIVWIEYF